MSSSAPRSGERVIHQDFIARIRYANTLPPPPNPPKLLDIPNTGLASGQYINPGFASRLAREQPLNIEADAELGMPLDLVGMPGIFDGDESSIQPSSPPPPLHPNDRPLLRPLSTLGRPKGTDTTVSFLRRTEYISSVASKRGSPAVPTAFLQPKLKRPEKRPPPEPDVGSPAAIRRKIEKSFEKAQRHMKDPRTLQHPAKKKNIRIVDSRPLLPDLDALPDSGAYVTVKLQTNPVPSSSTYDRRLLSAILQPIDKTAEEEADYQAAVEAHARAPDRFPKPSNLLDYNFFVPSTQEVGERFRVAFDLDNPDRDVPELATHTSSVLGPCFQFVRLRSYETAKESEFDAADKFSEELIVTFNDDENSPDGDDGTVMRQKAAYFYPVIQRTTVRPQRSKNITRNLSQMDEEKTVSQINVAVREPDADLRELLAKYKANPLLSHAEATEDAEADAGADKEIEEYDETSHQMAAPDGPLKDDASEDEHAQEAERASRTPSEKGVELDADGEDDAYV
ncbi:hypothetical protein ACRALDRAFT_2110521 [Sodiomyces alcalophilus JCM 7366]|uniref:uncharacterized protein n=1 Tax=Sodiomyces alcalophilus JCM 7366 TaxID=591952 RepID=UPI0039B40F42